jgi:hypothetical protein
MAAFFQRLAIALSCFHCPISEIDHLGRESRLSCAHFRSKLDCIGNYFV